TDAFDTNTRADAWNRSYTQSPMQVSQTGGQLVFTLAPNAVASSAYYSSASYDLTSSAVLIQVVTSANTATSAQTSIALDGQGNNRIVMREEKGQLVAGLSVAGAQQTIGSSLYDPTAHAWWRVRESGGTLFWETAPDGKTWSVQQQTSPLPF